MSSAPPPIPQRPQLARPVSQLAAAAAPPHSIPPFPSIHVQTSSISSNIVPPPISPSHSPHSPLTPQSHSPTARQSGANAHLASFYASIAPPCPTPTKSLDIHSHLKSESGVAIIPPPSFDSPPKASESPPLHHRPINYPAAPPSPALGPSIHSHHIPSRHHASTISMSLSPVPAPAPAPISSARRNSTGMSLEYRGGGPSAAPSSSTPPSSDSGSASPYTSASNYQLLDRIGSGSFGVVYRAHCKASGTAVALKIIPFSDRVKDVQPASGSVSSSASSDSLASNALDTRQFERTWREIRVTRFLSHPNLVRYRHAFIHDEQLWIVLPLMNCGNSKELLQLLYPHGIKDETLLAAILFEVLKAIDYLHSNGILHKDIKAENILLNEWGMVALADFGVAVDVREDIAGEQDKNREREDENETEETMTQQEKKADKDSESEAAHARKKFHSRKLTEVLKYEGSPCWMSPEIIGQSEFATQIEEPTKPLNFRERLMRRFAHNSTPKAAPLPSPDSDAPEQKSKSEDKSRSRSKSKSKSKSKSHRGAAEEEQLSSALEDIYIDNSKPPKKPEVATSPSSGHDDAHHSQHLLSTLSSHSDAYFFQEYCKSDIWSLGITALELAFGFPPFLYSSAVTKPAGTPSASIKSRLTAARYPGSSPIFNDPKTIRQLVIQSPAPSMANYSHTAEETAHFSTHFQQFLSACLEKHSSKRVTARHLMNHKFFSKVRKQAAYGSLNLNARASLKFTGNSSSDGFGLAAASGLMLTELNRLVAEKASLPLLKKKREKQMMEDKDKKQQKRLM